MILPDESWFNKPMRWAQLTLVENDPGHFDPRLPGDIDRSFWQVMCADHGRLLGNTMKGPLRELLPVAVEASVRVPSDMKIKALHLLVRGETIPFKIEGGKINLKSLRFLITRLSGLILHS